MIAQVYVDIAHRAVDQLYDYTVPLHLQDSIEIGMRLEVPFGRQTLSGVVINIKQTSSMPHEDLKPVRRMLDVTPVFDALHLALAESLAFYHVSPRMAYLQAMLPRAMRMRYEKRIRKIKEPIPEVLKEFFSKSDTVALDSVEAHMRLIKEAVKEGALEIETHVKQRQSPYTKTLITLKANHASVRGDKQQAIIDYLKNYGTTERKTLLNRVNASANTLNTLLKRNVVEAMSTAAYREHTALIQLKDKHVTLNADQLRVKEAIEESFDTFEEHLLYGVTSSGKTEVYIKLVEAVLARKKTALILVPEISLTPHLTARFKAVFNDQVAVYHSRLSDGEQYDAWRKAKRGDVSVMIGARSAVFTPLKPLGIIIVDEAHSESYRATSNPMYDARDVARTRGKTANIPVVYGSATPTVEQMASAKDGTFVLHQLPKRALDSTMPKIAVVDMKEELLKGNRSIFSSHLANAIQERLDRHEQILLMLNRRGHANFVMCRACGKSVECPECDLSLTYHKSNDYLRCHHCNHTEDAPKQCPQCGSTKIRYMGLGTEALEAATKNAFPTAQIMRMDHDTTRGKDGHEAVLHTFEQEGDILVGTQMIAKGLDFPKVTLVGVINADMALSLPDYYATEETFALLSQMAGRSGRRASQGDVFIQAYQSEHPVLSFVAAHDYEGFFEHELRFRKTANLPPFTGHIALRTHHPSRNEAHKLAAILASTIRKSASTYRVVGPVTPSIARLSGQYRMHVIVKYPDHEKSALYNIIHNTIQNDPRMLNHVRVFDRPGML